MLRRYHDVEVAPGQKDQVGLVDVHDALQQRGAWFVMLRVHDHIWNDKFWSLEIRWKASHQVWMLCNEVPPSAR
jgi:hypothetical protein